MTDLVTGMAAINFGHSAPSLENNTDPRILKFYMFDKLQMYNVCM